MLPMEGGGDGEVASERVKFKVQHVLCAHESPWNDSTVARVA